jgi:hypothetical protein
MINDIKCYFKINDTFTYKTIQIKTNKNYNERGINAQAHDIYKTENNNYTQTRNKIQVTNDTKCHLKTNDISLNKNMKIKTNKNNKDKDTYT